MVCAFSEICSPDDITYYNPHLGMCAKRDSYLRGLGKDTVKKSGIEIDLPFGSSRCIPCRPCKQGFYSDIHAYKCKLCTNCTELNRSERISCTSEEDTDCGEQVLIDGEAKVKKRVKIAVVGLAFVVIVILFGAMCAEYRRWKSKTAHQMQSSVLTEAGQCGSNDNASCSYHQTHKQGKHGTYNELDKIHNYFDTDDADDDDKGSLIPRSRTFRRKRTRRYSYPFGGLQTDDYKTDDNEPHNILWSLNAPVKNIMIEKVQTWDLIHEWSEKYNNTHTHSAHVFLTKYARCQQSALQKVQQRENKEELSPKFMSKVARYLGPQYKFRSLSRELGLSDTDLMNIQQNYKDDVVEQGYQVLLKLKQKELIQRKSDVINKIQDLGFNEVVDKINQ